MNRFVVRSDRAKNKNRLSIKAKKQGAICVQAAKDLNAKNAKFVAAITNSSISRDSH